jgi:hypothetical protein
MQTGGGRLYTEIRLSPDFRVHDLFSKCYLHAERYPEELRWSAGLRRTGEKTDQCSLDTQAVDERAEEAKRPITLSSAVRVGTCWPLPSISFEAGPDLHRISSTGIRYH